MGFFSDLKKKVLGEADKSTSPEGSNNVLLTQAVNLMLDNYQRIIQKAAEKVSNVKFENNFYNEYLIRKGIDEIEESIKACEKEIYNNEQIVRQLSIEIEELPEKIRKETGNSYYIAKDIKRVELLIKDSANDNNSSYQNKLIQLNADMMTSGRTLSIYNTKLADTKIKLDTATSIIEDNKIEIEVLKNKKLYNMLMISKIDECIRYASNIKNKDDFTKYAFEGFCHYNEKRYDKAIECFDRYASNPLMLENKVILLTYVELLMMYKRNEEAKKIALNLIDITPENVDIHVMLSSIHENLNEHEESKLEKKVAMLLE